MGEGVFYTANRKAAGTVEAVAEDVAGAAVQGAGPGTGRRRDGGGPPKSADGHAVENSVVDAKAARRGSEARRIRSASIRWIPTTWCR